MGNCLNVEKSKYKQEWETSDLNSAILQ